MLCGNTWDSFRRFFFAVSMAVSFLSGAWYQDIAKEAVVHFFASALEGRRGYSALWMWRHLVKLYSVMGPECAGLSVMLELQTDNHLYLTPSPLKPVLWRLLIHESLLASCSHRHPDSIYRFPLPPVCQVPELPRPFTHPDHWLLLLYLHSRKCCPPQNKPGLAKPVNFSAFQWAELLFSSSILFWVVSHILRVPYRVSSYLIVTLNMV